MHVVLRSIGAAQALHAADEGIKVAVGEHSVLKASID